MSRMKIQAGWTITSPEIIFPIYDLRPEEYTIPTVNEYSNDYPDGTVRSIAFTVSDPTNLYKLFPASIPRLCTEDGNINTVDIKFTEDSNNHFVIADTNFGAPVTAQPDDWGVNRYNYYTQNLSYGSRYEYLNSEPSSTRTGFTPNYVSTPFPTGRVYYRNENDDIRKNLTQIYRTANGSTFGVSKFIHYGGNNTKWQKWILAGSAPFNDTTYPYNNMGGYSWYWCPFGVTSSNFTGKPLSIYDVTSAGSGTPDQADTVTFNVLTIFVTMDYNGVRYTGVALVRMSGVPVEGQPDPVPVRITCTLFDDSFWGASIIGGGGSSGNWGADTTIDGGNGTFSAASDPHGDGTGTDIALTVTALNTASGYFAAQGGINVYRLDGSGGNISGLTGILQILFSSDYFTKFLTSMYNPLSAVLSAHLLPQALTTASGSARHVTAGGFDVSSYMSGTPSAAVASQFTHLHFAPIDIPHFSDSYADFAPYTSAKLHLPYCGVIDIDINKCMGGQLGVDYICDAISGNVAAWVWVSDPKDANSKQYAYIATGNAAYSFPMFAETQSGAAVGKLIGAAGSAAVGALTGNPFAAAGALSAGIDAVLTGHNTQINGTFSGNVGILTDPLCWLEITRPLWVQPSAYQQLHGITSHLSGTLADSGGDAHIPYSGFVVVSEIDLVTVNATDAELQEIERLLKSGVFIRTE